LRHLATVYEHKIPFDFLYWTNGPRSPPRRDPFSRRLQPLLSAPSSDQRAPQQRDEHKRQDGHDSKSEPSFTGSGFIEIQERNHSNQEDDNNHPSHHGSCKEDRFGG
jgi:hypothetical protein